MDMGKFNDWLQVSANIGIFSDRFSRPWWRAFGDTPSDYLLEELRLAINEAVANDDEDVGD